MDMVEAFCTPILSYPTKWQRRCVVTRKSTSTRTVVSSSRKDAELQQVYTMLHKYARDSTIYTLTTAERKKCFVDKLRLSKLQCTAVYS